MTQMSHREQQRRWLFYALCFIFSLPDRDPARATMAARTLLDSAAWVAGPDFWALL